MYKKMKVGEQVTYLARLKGMSAAEADKQIAYWFKKFDITSWWYKKVEELSKGMQQKVQFISTVIHQPKLLILDEPFSGLDPINANLIKDEIYELHKKGTTIIFSTHRMEQVEEICDHIVLINKGKNILTGHINDIRNQFKENLFKVSYEGHIPDEALNGLNIHEQTAQHLKIQLHPQNTTNSILAHLIDKGIHITAFHEELPSLNNIFINLVEQSNQHA
jgi:ABC-2 type transport system ATP-binding protein